MIQFCIIKTTRNTIQKLKYTNNNNNNTNFLIYIYTPNTSRTSSQALPHSTSFALPRPTSFAPITPSEQSCASATTNSFSLLLNPLLSYLPHLYRNYSSIYALQFTCMI